MLRGGVLRNGGAEQDTSRHRAFVKKDPTSSEGANGVLASSRKSWNIATKKKEKRRRREARKRTALGEKAIEKDHIQRLGERKGPRKNGKKGRSSLTH